MKIAIIYDLTELGGVQTCVFSLIKGLNRRGITPTLFWDEPPSKPIIDSMGLKLDYSYLKLPIRSARLKKLPATVRYMIEPFDMFNISRIPKEFDFVYAFMPFVKIDQNRPHLFYLSGPPLLPQLEPSDIKFRIGKAFYKIFLERFYPAYIPQKNANYVINSRYTADMYLQAHQEKPEVVYPSNQLDFEEKTEFNLTQRKYTTFFSRIMKYKRPEMLFELAAKNPDREFVIMGGVSPKRENYLNELRNEAKSKRLSNIRFVPNASNEEVDQILKQTLIYFFPAVNEHFGITTVEAILKGCIPLVHNSGGQIEIVPNQELRFDDDDFVEKYSRLISMSEYQLTDLMVTLERHIEKFSEGVYISKMLAFLENHKID
ncbi:MAG: glycosyltransferase [Weeksellaceae bacterium]